MSHYIGGRFVPAHSTKLINVIDPSTQEVIGRISDGNAAK